jgi:imidazolonepropionase-like amidohydrolase
MRENPPRHMDYDLVRRYVTPEKMQYALKNGRFGQYPKEFWPVNLKNSLDRIFAGYKAGVKVRAGTDATMAEVFYGLSLHWELELFNMAGLTPLETLHLGTVDGAETVGAQNDLGTLAPGKLADVVILDADPLENIRNTMKIWQVIRAGQIFDPYKLRTSSPPQAQ